MAFQPRNGGGGVTRGSVDGGPTTGACVIRDGDFERPWGGVARPRPDAIMDECNSYTIAPVCASIRTTHRRACAASLPQGLPPLAKHALSTCATSERRMAAHASTPAWLIRRPQKGGSGGAEVRRRRRSCQRQRRLLRAATSDDLAQHGRRQQRRQKCCGRARMVGQVCRTVPSSTHAAAVVWCRRGWGRLMVRLSLGIPLLFNLVSRLCHL